MTSTADLARELDVPIADVEAHVDNLISLDGEAAVVASRTPTGHHQGSYAIVVVELTDAAADTIRAALTGNAPS